MKFGSLQLTAQLAGRLTGFKVQFLVVLSLFQVTSLVCEYHIAGSYQLYNLGKVRA